MVFLWFNEDVNSRECKRVQLDIQQALARNPVVIRGDMVRATLEISADKRPWNKAQTIFLCVVCANLQVYGAKRLTSGGSQQGFASQ